MAIMTILITFWSFIILLLISKAIGGDGTQVSILMLSSIVIGCTTAIIETIKTHCPIKSNKEK